MDARGPRARRGSALVSSLVVVAVLFGMIVSTTALSTVEVRSSRKMIDELRTKYLAESAVTVGIQYLDNVANKAPQDPIGALEELFAVQANITPFLGDAVMDGVNSMGEYTVRMSLVESTPASISILLEASGYLPAAPQNLPVGARVDSWHSLSTTVEFAVEASEIFDYAYFINNWGWLYGNTIFCNGNARSNGQFDAGGYAPTITGQPVYDSVVWDGTSATLVGYKDDNGDGLKDGRDGGVFSGWDVVNSGSIAGEGGNAANQHDFQDPVEMPNLSDLSVYKAQAISEASSISISGTVMTDAVFGDGAGETGNLYLVGTIDDPIVLDGPVVVEGDLIISGYVTGQGAIYTGGNVYVPESLNYLDGPSSTRPTSNSQDATEKWLTDNWNKDFLGLFSAENVVVGDFTNSTWRSYVGGWMGSSLNSSKEDAGADGIPNTTKGKDGIAGTADDDVLENDALYTVEYYTQADADYGLIPAGKLVGDVIPGTGEDIDGDGAYDGTIDLADLDFAASLTALNWGGNFPGGGISDYSDVSTVYANNLDAVFYTNHSFSYVVFGGSTAKINGALVSRNENIVYGTPTIEMNYDCRILGGNSGMAGSLLPKTLQTPSILRWARNERDPNAYTVAP